MDFQPLLATVAASASPGSQGGGAESVSGLTVALVGVAGVVLGGVITAIGSWNVQAALQRKQFEREDRESRRLVRAVLSNAVECAGPAWTKALADPAKWEPLCERLNSLMQPRILGALSGAEVDAVANAQLQFEVATIRLKAFMGSSEEFLRNFMAVFEGRAYPTEEARNMKHLEAVHEIMRDAKLPYESLLRALAVMGSPRDRERQLEPYQAVNLLRRSRGLPEMQRPANEDRPEENNLNISPS